MNNVKIEILNYSYKIINKASIDLYMLFIFFYFNFATALRYLHITKYAINVNIIA